MPKASWHRMVSPGGEVVWTDTPGAYEGWTESEAGMRPPGRFEDKIKGRWAIDGVALADAQEDERLLGLTPRQRHAEAIDKAVGRLRADLGKGAVE